ncbi:RDD family protein [Cellulosimicrobium sp. CUA-896]|uniref:RDD family protein n=1 Tax=Cellulosimicrobium sp. CUA-896 TaxID=1517881 RepID=UPI000B0DE3C8|nr:RDD family protein [Cellulosimicrobium sp. CUA-896]
MTDVTCRACGSAQPDGAAFCAVCGQPFTRSGGPAGPVPGPPPTAAPRSTPPDTTTEPEVYAATQRAALPAPVGSAPALAAAATAGLGRRVLAYVVDAAVPGLLVLAVVLVGLATTGAPLLGGAREVTAAEASALLGRTAVVYGVAARVALAWWVATWAWEGSTGKTLGNLATGIRTVDAQSRAPIGFGRALVRWLVVGAGALVLLVGQWVVVVSPAFDSSGRRQGWQDKAARAVVVDARRVPPPPAAPPSPRAAAPADPWAFPAAAARPAAPSTSEGLITGVPGRGAPASAPSPPAAPAVPAVPAAPALPDLALPAAEPADLDAEWDSTRLSVADVRAMDPAPVVPVVLELESGERHVVDGRALLGRDPQASDGEAPILVAVADRSVSKTHAELGVDPGGLWIVDRGSTNGTVVSVPGAPPRLADPGARVRVPVGATIHVATGVCSCTRGPHEPGDRGPPRLGRRIAPRRPAPAQRGPLPRLTVRVPRRRRDGRARGRRGRERDRRRRDASAGRARRRDARGRARAPGGRPGGGACHRHRARSRRGGHHAERRRGRRAGREPVLARRHVGDSRTYHLSAGRLDQVSVDHSEVQEMVDAGLLTPGEALTHPRRHVVTRALGSRTAPRPDFWYVPITQHDRVLVCSDGLTGELSDERITELLLENPDPQRGGTPGPRGHRGRWAG